jgi:hypothetical protein
MKIRVVLIIVLLIVQSYSKIASCSDLKSRSTCLDAIFTNLFIFILFYIILLFFRDNPPKYYCKWEGTGVSGNCVAATSSPCSEDQDDLCFEVDDDVYKHGFDIKTCEDFLGGYCPRYRTDYFNFRTKFPNMFIIFICIYLFCWLLK